MVINTCFCWHFLPPNTHFTFAVLRQWHSYSRASQSISFQHVIESNRVISYTILRCCCSCVSRLGDIFTRSVDEQQSWVFNTNLLIKEIYNFYIEVYLNRKYIFASLVKICVKIWALLLIRVLLFFGPIIDDRLKEKFLKGVLCIHFRVCVPVIQSVNKLQGTTCLDNH